MEFEALGYVILKSCAHVIWEVCSRVTNSSSDTASRAVGIYVTANRTLLMCYVGVGITISMVIVWLVVASCQQKEYVLLGKVHLFPKFYYY